MEKIIVVILENDTRKCDKNVANLSKLFSDAKLKAYVLNPIFKGQFSCKLNNSDFIENYKCKKALEFAKDVAGDTHVLVVKDSSICQLSPLLLHEKISTLLKSGKDLCYLTSESDDCLTYKLLYDNIYTSRRPTSTQCILFNAYARDYILNNFNIRDLSLSNYLNSLISKHILKSCVCFPNIFFYDITFATKKKDLLKTNLCTNANTDNADFSYSYLCLILIACLFLCFFILYQ